jgi:hypothetical protein
LEDAKLNLGKILMSKFFLNLLVQISKALVNSKVQFLIQKLLFFAFGPADLAAHSAFGPAGSAGLSSPVGQNRPSRPTCAISVIAKVRFLLSFTPSVLGTFSLSTADAWAPCVSPIFPTASADPGRKSSTPPLPASPAPRLGCRQVFTTPLIISPP